MTRKQTKWIASTAIAIAIVAGGAAIAAESGADKPLPGSDLERAVAAALDHVGGGTLVDSERNDAGYSVEICRTDGRAVEVEIDAHFKIIGEEGDETGDVESEDGGDAPGEGIGGKPIEGRLRDIPQPVVEGIAIAPESKRVDVAMPVFSHPTSITNPLFPVSSQASVLMLGEVEGKPFRTEVTLLPYVKIIDWEGQLVETVVSQYVAYLDGRIEEVAYDLYAQDDAGSVWYFGEDVFNFNEGVIIDTHGTWTTGKDGPAAMIMPASPKVGDIYRPENIPGFVFEEVTVKAVAQALDGPLGPVNGGLVVEELHMDNGKENKTFAPGYGEFFTGGDGDVEALALAVPTDALSGSLPIELKALETGAAEIFMAARSKDWKAAGELIKAMDTAWESYRTTVKVPGMIETRLTAGLELLAKGVSARNAVRSQQTAIDVAQSSLDLQLRYRPVPEIDLARFGLWARRILVDVAKDDAAAINGDNFTLDIIRDRIIHALRPADAARLNAQLEVLQTAIADEAMAAVTKCAQLLQDLTAGFEPQG